MLKNTPLLVTAACGLCAALALAQEAPPAESAAAPVTAVEKKADEAKPGEHSTAEKVSARPTPKPTLAVAAAAPVPEVVATPKPKKPSFFQRFFGGRKRTPAATPSPTASPTPTPTPTYRKSAHKPASTPSPATEPATPTPKPGKWAKPAPTPKLDMPKVAGPSTGKVPPSATPSKVAPTSTPAKVSPSTTVAKVPSPETKSPSATPKPPTATPAKKAGPTKPAVTEAKKPLIEPPADADPDVKERFRFDQAKAKAVEDPQVKSLKAKADDASTDEESRKALRAYNKALFEKIRKIDSGVAERADRLEAAILKRLSE